MKCLSPLPVTATQDRVRYTLHYRLFSSLQDCTCVQIFWLDDQLLLGAQSVVRPINERDCLQQYCYDE